MPSSQNAATERRNDRMISHEPPKLKTTLKTSPKQATNPLQFVKVGPCSLYRTAQEQLQKVQEVKKVKQEVRDDPEDWQSNLDNWKSSRRKRQEHIIERVVEVKKLELEEHDRHRRRSKTFSEMMEERSSRGRKLSMSLALYHEEDSNDLSDLGIGTSSGKSSVSGDTHDDTQSVLSDRDSEIDKNHSDLDNTSHENGNTNDNNNISPVTNTVNVMPITKMAISKKSCSFGNGFQDDQREYDSGTTATTSSPEPDEYNYEGAIRYNRAPPQTLPRTSLIKHESKLDNKSIVYEEGIAASDKSIPVVKVDVLKRREIFEKAAQKTADNKVNNNASNRSSGDFSSSVSIKERLLNLEKQTVETGDEEEKNTKVIDRLSGDMTTIRERLSCLEKQVSVRENKTSRKLSSDEFEPVRPLRERLSTLEKYASSDDYSSVPPLPPVKPQPSPRQHVEFTTKVKDRLSVLDSSRSSNHNNNINNNNNNVNNNNNINNNKDVEKKPVDKQILRFTNREMINETSTPSERSSSPDSEYRAPRATFHQSLDSLDADASSEPDTFDRVQSLEELDYVRRRYPTSVSSAEILNDTDREDSGIHTADVSCSVSQADEPVDEEVAHPGTSITVQVREPVQDDRNDGDNDDDDEEDDEQVVTECNQLEKSEQHKDEDSKAEISQEKSKEKVDSQLESAVIIEGTAETTGKTLPTNKPQTENSNISPKSSNRVIVYQSPRIPPRRCPPAKPTLDNSSSPSLQEDFESESPESKNPFKFNESKTSSAESISFAPLKPSKIPTPLPRKPATIKLSSSVPSSPPSSPIKQSTCSKSLPSSPLSFKPPSKIPSPLKTQEDTSAGEFNLNINSKSERRRTIFEVCEKIIVPQDLSPVLPVTPFITVTKVDFTDDHHQQQQQPSDSEESIVIGSSFTLEPEQRSSESVEQEEEEEEEEEEARASESTSSGNQSAELPLTCPNVEAANNAAPPVIVVDQDIYQDSQSESVASSTPLSYETESNISDYDKPTVVSPIAMEFIDTSMSLSKSIFPLNLSSDEEILNGLIFPLGPPSSVEPPKEKPPPPPTDLSDEENQPIEPLKRLNSTRRIKKELRTRRSDFLGIEGVNDDDLEFSLAKPPDMAAILAEERRIEQMHRRSYDTDSNYEQDSSHERDSGVELSHVEDWIKQPVSPDMSQHSRQSSEPFGASVTSSEEDEITKKEREIIEVLEKEEQWRYGNDREQNSDIGEKLAHKLRELEEEKMQLERERAQEVVLHRQDDSLRKNEEIQPRNSEEDHLRNQQQQQQQQQLILQQQEITMQSEVIRDEEMELREQEKLRFEVERLKLHEDIYDKERRNVDIRRQDDVHLRSIDRPTRQPEHTVVNAVMCDHDDEYSSGEVLRVERELLQLEQEALKRQRTNMVYREQKQQQLAEQLQEQWQSLQNVNYAGNIVHATYQNIDMANYRSSMPNLQLQDNQRRRPAPPPIPPAKPLRLIDQRQRDMTIRNSRIPSADSIPQQVDASLRHSTSAIALSTHAGQQMTKQTLNALSAVPRTRIVKNDQWVQRRKSDGPRIISQDLNYQHWLIQEAEQRRINEKNQRSPPQRKPQQHVTGTSVPYTATTTSYKSEGKPLPDSIIQTLTQRIQNRAQERPLPLRRRIDHSASQEHLPQAHHQPSAHLAMMHQKAHQSPGTSAGESQEKLLSVSGKKKCSHCGDELGRGAAMIIESLRLFYHMECFKCCVCHVRLGDGLMGTDVRVRNHKLHCHNCYSSDDGVKFSCV